MSFRRYVWSAFLGLTILSGRSALAGEPASLAPLPVPLAGANQALADVIVSHLRHSGVLRNYRVDVSAQGGVVELTGSVTDRAQRDEVMHLVQGVPGVERVVEHLRLSSITPGVLTVQGPALPPKLPEPIPGPGVDSGPRTIPDLSGGMNGNRGNGALIPDPVPMDRTQPPAYAQMNPPRMPPYAWPTYAPYNNFSRVATPTAFPAQAFPFIGPVYPFPKVPLGWRSVKLEWDDGYWWFGQVGNKYNWWKLRYH